MTLRLLLLLIRAQLRQPSYFISTFEGAKWLFTMFTLPLLHPTKPPMQLLLVPVSEPSKRQSTMVSCPPPHTATMPPLVASPLTVLPMLTDEWQFSMMVFPLLQAAMPPTNFWLLVMVPAVCRLRMVASPTL